MGYCLAQYLGGMEWWQAYAKFDMDFTIYVSRGYVYAEKNLLNSRVDRRGLRSNRDRPPYFSLLTRRGHYPFALTPEAATRSACKTTVPDRRFGPVRASPVRHDVPGGRNPSHPMLFQGYL
jgi:hypothetical protein